MNQLEKELLNEYCSEIRKAMNSIIQEINGDFTDWCELGTMLMFRLVRDTIPTLKNEVAVGWYKGSGHFWNIIDGEIIDTTVDQFGKIKPGVINKKWIKNYKIKNIKILEEEDSLHMTDDIYDYICELLYY